METQTDLHDLFHLRTTAKPTLTFMFFKSTYFLAAPEPACSTQDLQSSLWHMEPLAAAWDLVPQPGMKPGCPALGARSLSP